ncbi:MAG: ORF2 protein [Upsilontorquevirus procy7]|uniref:ORF2 protein n=1 Tax=Anelloviridae sp. TaxID=2055263 RepID=A0A3G2YT69_9VIRU|nr:MAG: ORF2 protein [Anelloviridae sp.]AYP28768.1 MAG: ORF2 protein [Anelloviridae sp.]
MQEHNRKQALWRQACSAMHKTWCNCGCWWMHVPGWGISRGGLTTPGGDITDLSFVTEDTTGGDTILGGGGDISVGEDGAGRRY